MRIRTTARLLITIIGILALGLSTQATLLGARQDATPDATPTAVLERASAYPVSIHQGTCLDFVAQPVGPAIDAAVAGRNGNPEPLGISSEGPALAASADYDGTLAYFTETPHVVAIHESAEEFGNVIACGQIAGFVDDGTLVFAIRGQEGATVSGIGIFEENTTIVDDALDLIDQEVDFGDDSVHVTAYIVSGNTDISGDR